MIDRGAPRRGRQRGAFFRASQRQRQTGVGHDVPQCGYCRKRSYETRAHAKAAIRRLHPDSGVGQMTAYRCTAGGSGWHIGHRDPYFTSTDDQEGTTA